MPRYQDSKAQDRKKGNRGPAPTLAMWRWKQERDDLYAAFCHGLKERHEEFMPPVLLVPTHRGSLSPGEQADLLLALRGLGRADKMP